MVINYGGRGLQNGRGDGGGGQVKFYPYEKGGGGTKNVSGGEGAQSFEVVFTWELEVLAILKGDRKNFPLFKRGVQKVVSCLEGGGAQKVLDPRFSHFVAPPPPRN